MNAMMRRSTAYIPAVKTRFGHLRSFNMQSKPHGMSVWTMPIVIECVQALLFAAQEYSVATSFGVPTSWWRHVAKALVFCSPWALFAPGVRRLVQRAIRFTWPQWKTTAALLTLGAGACALQSLLMTTFAHTVKWRELQLAPGRPSPFAYEIARRAVGTITGSLLQILLFALVYYALEQFRERQSRDLAESELRNRLAEAELGSLRTQLQPHFLFNTLNTISALMRSDPDAGQRVIAGLGDLLRASLDQLREQQVSLDEELDFLRLYLDIQQARLGDRLSWDLDVQSDVRSALVPSLLLQPLVENAFRHGLEPKQGSGRVSVRVRRDGAALTIEIDDDGRGPGTLPCTEGIGLRNTRERLARLYDNDWSLDLQPGAECGTIVRIRLPFEPDERLAADIQRR